MYSYNNDRENWGKFPAPKDFPLFCIMDSVLKEINGNECTIAIFWDIFYARIEMWDSFSFRCSSDEDWKKKSKSMSKSIPFVLLIGRSLLSHIEWRWWMSFVGWGEAFSTYLSHSYSALCGFSRWNLGCIYDINVKRNILYVLTVYLMYFVCFYFAVAAPPFPSMDIISLYCICRIQTVLYASETIHIITFNEKWIEYDLPPPQRNIKTISKAIIQASTERLSSSVTCLSSSKSELNWNTMLQATLDAVC